MPWSVKKDGDTYCVVKEGETSAIKGGCHGSKSEAAAHVRALYASEAEHAVSELYEVADIEEEADMEEFVEGDNFEFSDSMKEHPWTGPIVFENVYTGDNRVFKSDSINWQEDTLPWAFRWQKASSQGHAGSVPVGRVDRLERKEDGSIVGFGVVIPELSDEAEQYYKLLKSGAGGGVSVDGDSAQFEIQEEEGSQPKVEFSSMRLRALSAVDIPAFNGARIHLIEDEEEVSTDEVSLEITDLQEELADKKPFPFEKKEEKDEDEDSEDDEEDKEEDSEDSEDKDSEEDEDDEDKDKKKFPFEKKVTADLDLREELAKKKRKKKKMSYGWQIDEALTAAAIPVLPSTDSFIDPVFEGPTPLTVTPDGKVAGHLALFNTCHIGFPGTCVKPPKGSKYQYFHTGQIETAEGDLVEVGKLTFKTGHASMSSNPRVAAEHYDNTGAVAADVRAGEDKFGIWVTGALRPHLSDEDIREFRAAPLSGDWRRIAGKLELVGALSVNVPGFPVPRVRAMVASGETEALFTFLTDDNEEFVIGEEELILRIDRKLDLAAKVSEFLGEEIDTEAPEGEISDDIPDAPTKSEINARAETYTQNQFFEDLKALRELLDSDEKMPKKVRETLEILYAAAIKTDDDGKRTTYSGYDLDTIENSGLTIEEWTAEFELSGLDIQEFYNTCHDENGKFCPGSDGPGRLRDNVKGKHFIPGEPHGKDHPGHSIGSPSSGGGGGSSSGGGGGGSSPRSTGGGPPPSGPPSGPPGGGGGGGVNPRVYENYITTRSRARGWGAAATIAALALNSPASPFLAGLATAGGIGIVANPAVLTLAFVTGVAYAGKNIVASRKHRAEYNRSVQRKLKTDRLNERQQRERDRLRVTT